MLQPQQVEDLICLISSLDRGALLDQFHRYRAAFPLDFTDTFLLSLPLDRLRHIFLAVCIQSQHIPTMIESDAA